MKMLRAAANHSASPRERSKGRFELGRARLLAVVLLVLREVDPTRKLLHRRDLCEAPASAWAAAAVLAGEAAGDRLQRDSRPIWPCATATHSESPPSKLRPYLKRRAARKDKQRSIGGKPQMQRRQSLATSRYMQIERTTRFRHPDKAAVLATAREVVSERRKPRAAGRATRPITYVLQVVAIIVATCNDITQYPVAPCGRSSVCPYPFGSLSACTHIYDWLSLSRGVIVR